MLPPSGRSAAALAALLAALTIQATPSPALANGRFPAAGQIAVHPTDPERIFVRATYGMLLTEDGGDRWGWVCEPAIGYSGVEDPMVSFTADGTLLAGIFDGLSISHDRGCQWDFAGGGLEERYAIDLSVDKADPTKAIVLVSNSTGLSTFLTQVWESSDDAKTFTQAGADLPADFLGLTLDAAPSDPQRIYVSGRFGSPDYTGVLERTDDRGATWQTFPIPGSNDQHLPYIGAIDPKNPDIVYVRLDGSPVDELVVSKDGGQSWESVYLSVGDLLGFAISPDGSRVAIGGPDDGLLVASADTLQFQPVSDEAVGVRCLTWTATGLYACADEFVDKFTAGLSTDEGKTFTPIMHLFDLCGPLACDPGTSVGKECPTQWGATKITIGAQDCDAVDAGPDGGSSTGGASTDGEGCSCATPGAASRGAGLGLSLLAALGLLVRRARKRRSRATS